MTTPKKTFSYFLLFVFIISSDIATKIWALKNLISQNITVCPYLNFGLSINRGVSWSFFSSQSNLKFYLLTLLIITIISIFIIHTYKEYKNQKNIFFEILIISGAISNIIDRFLYSGVIDFIDFHINTWHWPTFNIADISIVIGIIGVLGRYIYHDKFRKN